MRLVKCFSTESTKLGDYLERQICRKGTLQWKKDIQSIYNELGK